MQQDNGGLSGDKKSRTGVRGQKMKVQRGNKYYSVHMFCKICVLNQETWALRGVGGLACMGEACVLCLHPHSDLSNERHSSSTPVTSQPIRRQYYKTRFLPSARPTGAVWNKVFLHFVRRQEALNPILCFVIHFFCNLKRDQK